MLHPRKCRSRRTLIGALRSDNEYGGDARRNRSLILSQTQALSQADEPTATSFQGQGDNEAGPSRIVYQRTGDRNLSRYRKLNTKIVAEIRTHLR